jgi:hypothetical protein
VYFSAMGPTKKAFTPTTPFGVDVAGLVDQRLAEGVGVGPWPTVLSDLTIQSRPAG